MKRRNSKEKKTVNKNDNDTNAIAIATTLKYIHKNAHT